MVSTAGMFLSNTAKRAQRLAGQIETALWN